jgi:2-methylisocitrate lyase-like PEP mutase family enzyme
LSLDEVLEHLRLLCAATDLPVNADFEGGFADEPEGVATNVALALDTGVSGLSIEDRTGGVLYRMAFSAAFSTQLQDRMIQETSQPIPQRWKKAYLKRQDPVQIDQSPLST